MSTLSVAVREASAHDLEDLTAYVVAECEMVTQDADGNMVDIDPKDVIAALKAWAQMHLEIGGRGGLE